MIVFLVIKRDFFKKFHADEQREPDAGLKKVFSGHPQ
jgi:hypothetical protein